MLDGQVTYVCPLFNGCSAVERILRWTPRSNLFFKALESKEKTEPFTSLTLLERTLTRQNILRLSHDLAPTNQFISEEKVMILPIRSHPRTLRTMVHPQTMGNHLTVPLLGTLRHGNELQVGGICHNWFRASALDPEMGTQQTGLWVKRSGCHISLLLSLITMVPDSLLRSGS